MWAAPRNLPRNASLRALHEPIGCVTTIAMSIVSEILEFNTQFVQKREYEPFRTDVFPDKRLVVLTCMDTRLVELLPRAMNLRNGDAKVIKNAGAIVSHPFGSVMRSVLVAVYELQAAEVAVVGHYNCGISPETIKTLGHSGIDLAAWLKGFDSPEEGVRQSVEVIRMHPLLPKDV